MEDLQSMTPRKRKRIEWWQNHKPENQKIRKKSHIGYKKKVKKDVQEKAIPEEGASAQDDSNSKTENEGKQDKRYILFIGNMPYTVKEEDVKWHFRCTGKGSIKDFRLMTKKTGESKGCGFIEFNNKESYWKALNLHHSTLDGRKINVEITCGGGGKGQTRKKKLEERKTNNMASEESLLFCVPEFSTQVFSGLHKLRKEGKLCDIYLRVGECNLQSHRVVLAAASSYFNAMFTGDMKESRQDEVTLFDVEFSALEDLVNFCYTGRIEINAGNVQNLLSASSLLQLASVKQACVQFLHRVLHPTNCLGIRSFADTYSCVDLVEAADVFAVKNFSEVARSEEFLTLSPEDVVEMISREELNVRTEEEVFEAISAWVCREVDERKDFLPELLKNVRLPLISPQYLCDKVSSNELIKNNLACRDLVDEAKDYLLMPERRSKLQSVRTKPRRCSEAAGLIYAIGGLTSSGEALSTVEAYDTLTGQWLPGVAMSTLRTRVGVAVLDNKLYALGGFDGHKRLSTVECYDPQLKSWKAITPMNTRRSALGAVVLNGRVYVVGGYDGHISLSTVECYSPESNMWSFVTPMGTLRSAAGVTELNGKIYAIGGHNGLSIFNTVEVYDPKTDSWSSSPPMGVRRCRVGVATLNGRIYVCGGYDGSTFLNTVECFDPETGQWTFTTPMNTRRSRVAVVTLGGRLYAIGGYDGLSNLNTVECFDVLSNKWTPVASMGMHQGGVGVSVLPRVHHT
ncbi:unnamed protein product [Porites evermanni]|uniref:Uncharacterized protein n=1 Tax=Porites evermanni TaxID=104178 RepID=A0ABN8RYV8_9CNID|nr:unnamed protein product [Porites evermanni]